MAEHACLASRLRTVKQVAEAYVAFTEASLRWLIFNLPPGFAKVVVRVNSRVYLDVDALDEWLERHRLAG